MVGRGGGEGGLLKNCFGYLSVWELSSSLLRGGGGWERGRGGLFKNCFDGFVLLLLLLLVIHIMAGGRVRSLVGEVDFCFIL